MATIDGEGAYRITIIEKDGNPIYQLGTDAGQEEPEIITAKKEGRLFHFASDSPVEINLTPIGQEAAKRLLWLFNPVRIWQKQYAKHRASKESLN